jgi:Tol biopolymer transport system component
MTTRLPLFAWLSAVLALVALGVASRAEAAFPGINGKIAFQSNRDGNDEIYAMNADGSTQTRLTNNATQDRSPAWSPDGSKIAFSSNRDGNFEIYSMNADGSTPTRLTNNPASDLDPGWSPDGTKVVFETNRDGNSEIYSINANGTSPTNLTSNSAGDFSPAWSPDGTKIAFQTTRDGNFEIYKMNANGTMPERLTNTGAFEDNPAWLPDAGRIAFETDRTGNYEVYVMFADGTGAMNFTNNAATDYAPAWSPDWDRYVFATTRDGNTEIYRDDVLAAAFTRLTNNAAADDAPDWQPVVRNYARPRGATPTRIPLTPAYRQCTATNTSHQPPIISSACSPPEATSSFLTVGTPDFNGQGAGSLGSVLFNVKPTAPPDGLINVSLTDVRCQGGGGGCAGGALSDYSGNLGFDATFRITDRLNGSGNVPGTAFDLPLRFPVPCTPTASTTIGSTCATSTTINTVLGGAAIVASKRAIWQMTGDVNLYDGGPTGAAGDSNATLFAVAGLFFP